MLAPVLGSRWHWPPYIRPFGKIMTNLSSPRLLQLLTAATGGKPEPSEWAPKPVIMQVPKLGRVRAYLWTVTPDMSEDGRPWDEHKAQIILPFTKRKERQHLTVDEIPTFLMGYSPLFGVFVFWEARLHQDSAWSKNLQVKEGLLEQASTTGWAIAPPRRTDQGPEIRAAIHPGHVRRYMSVSVRADREGLTADARASYLDAYAPDLDGTEIRARTEAGELFELPVIDRQRIATIGTRLARDGKFADKILTEFNKKCAVCGMQLTILDGAHIVPVHDPRGVDEVWNGLALCKNHHALYDKKILLIDGRAFVRVNVETIETLNALGCLGGYEEAIEPFVGQQIRNPPNFFGVNGDLTTRMKAALKLTYQLSPV